MSRFVIIKIAATLKLTHTAARGTKGLGDYSYHLKVRIRLFLDLALELFSLFNYIVIPHTVHLSYQTSVHGFTANFCTRFLWELKVCDLQAIF